MNRIEFLKSMGFKGGALMAVLTSCVNAEDTYVDAMTYDPNAKVTTPTGVAGSSTKVTTEQLNAIKSPLLKLTLADAGNANLAKVGGYIRKSGIVVAQINSGSYAAVTQLCTHEPKNDVIYTPATGEFYRTAHGARFTLAGKGLNKEGNKGITTHKVATDGTSWWFMHKFFETLATMLFFITFL